MKIDIVEDTGKALKFTLRDSDSGFANALRRVAVNHVQCFAIDTVTFYENSSAMFDEYIAHRMGLIPIVTPATGYNQTDEILFTLEAMGPKTVYSAELQSTDKDVRPSSEKIPIIRLGQDQQLRVDAKAVMGEGARHAKFQPGIVTFENAGDDKTFNFYVETFGQMPPREIINKALTRIKDEIKEVEKEVKKL